MSGKLYNIISRVMNVPASRIDDKSGPETIENWDSFSGLILLDELQSTFNVKFTLDESLSTKNVEGIKMNLAKRGVVLD